MMFNRDDPRTWPCCRPLIIAHDVGRSRDRSTAVVGGNSPVEPRLVGILESEELPQGLFGSQRASALAAVDRRHCSNAIIVADLSFDPTYAEVLHQTFGARAIGLQIGSHGEGLTVELRPVNHGAIRVYTIGRTYLLELLHSEFQSDRVRIVDGASSRRAYEQLEGLETEMRERGMIYTCPPGKHDDLAMSWAMLAWAAGHPHLPYWVRTGTPRPRRPKPYTTNSGLGWT
jgi:hypothetical protein